jgi:predicted kinase
MVLYLIRGAPGSGKSTLADLIVHSHQGRAVWCEADHFMVGEDGRYAFDPTRLQECHAQCRAKAVSAMGEGSVVIVSNTFTKLWEIKDYLEYALLFGYEVVVLHCTRKGQTVHGVPPDKVEWMISNFEPYETEVLHG